MLNSWPKEQVALKFRSVPGQLLTNLVKKLSPHVFPNNSLLGQSVTVPLQIEESSTTVTQIACKTLRFLKGRFTVISVKIYENYDRSWLAGNRAQIINGMGLVTVI